MIATRMTGLHATALALLLAGCSMVPDARPMLGFGNQWTATTNLNDAPIAERWWTQLGSAELDRVMTQALDQNNNLVAAGERIAQARGSLRQAGASLLPSVNAGAASNYSRVDMDGSTSNSNSVNLTASYELDLFGANRARRAAAAAQLEAAGFDRDAVRLTLTSDVVQGYVNLLATRERVALATENLTASKEILRLLEVRLAVGSIGLLEVSQQRSSVAQAEASLASLREQESAYLNALAILAGVAPQDFTVEATRLAGLTLPEVPVAAPATLLERRPDLKVAEANLRAANADIGAARAAFFPTTTLSAGFGQGFDPATTGLNLGAALLAPIFNGGATKGALQSANARQRELVAMYRQAVLTSFGEAGNALAAVSSADTRRASQTVAATEADTALRLARLQLEAGTIDMPTLLTTQTSRLTTRDAQVQAEAAALTARVQLVRVMGGPLGE